MPTNMDLDGTGQAPEQREDLGQSTSRMLGTLEIDGVGIFTAFYARSRNQTTWVLMETSIFDEELSATEKQKRIVAVLQSKNNGTLTGYGKTYYLTRLLDNISAMMYKCVNLSEVQNGFFTTGEYSDQQGSYIQFQAWTGGAYRKLALAYEGFRLDMTSFGRSLQVKLPKLEPVQDNKSKAAIVANLGVKTAAALMRRMGDRLAWFKNKNYILIDTKEKFQDMMLRFLQDVQTAYNNNKRVLTGIDTETTGLNMLNLSKDNPLRDTIVSIPFAWKDGEAYVICTDMYYFSNVGDEEVYPLFNRLFSRNDDYTFQDIELDYCGVHFKFNRRNITVAGFNAFFDEKAFMCHDCDLFFDEDAMILLYNLDTDLIQGKEGQEETGSYLISNSLKGQTRRLIGDETLELEELYGKAHKDKYRYLQDMVLALMYGGADADYTRLITKIAISMTDPVLHQQYRKYDMTTLFRMAKASWHGMPVDSQSVQEQGDLVNRDLEALKNFIYHYAYLANRDTLQEKSAKLQELLGADTPMEVEDIASKDKMFRYPFTPANHKKLLFGMLGYPVLKRNDKSGEPALDKFVLKKLMSKKRDTPVEILQESLMSVSDPNVALVDKDEFNSDAFPLARVFSTYATLNKEYTSYYKPIIENDMEGKMFYNFNMARAATRRILSPGQTMKGSLKSLVIAPPGKIFMSFDASQIEYRHMASLAYIRSRELLQKTHPEDWEQRLNSTAVATIHSMMQKEEADYHIETAATMTGVRQHQVTPKVRKTYKSIGFGIPYGLGDRSMCESIFGAPNEENMAKTKDLLNQYKVKQAEIIDLLEEARDNAFVPAQISDQLREYLRVGKTHVGIVRNFTGFYRLFVLENLTRARTGRIRRQAGNCIIQGGAAELFRRMLYNFHVGSCKAGINNKITWLMTVHDELDAIIDDDIDIVLLIKVLYENCTLRYEGHIPYYIGINFGANWEDAKSDDKELPVIMVQRMVAAYDDGKFSIPSDGHQAEHLMRLKRHYMCDRVYEELHKLIPELEPGYQWTDEAVELVDEHFSNYVVRAYMAVFCAGKKPTLREQLEGWQKAREEYGFHVGFLTEKLVDYRENIGELDLGTDELDLTDMDFSLGLELFDNSSEEDALNRREDNDWFNEAALFDQSIPSEELVIDEGIANYIYARDGRGGDDDYVLNSSPTSAFDVFVSTKYVRTKVLLMGDKMYSAMTSGSPYQGKEKVFAAEIKKHFTAGDGTIIIIGREMLKVTGVNCNEDDLDWLDKKLCGKQEG